MWRSAGGFDALEWVQKQISSDSCVVLADDESAPTTRVPAPPATRACDSRAAPSSAAATTSRADRRTPASLRSPRRSVHRDFGRPGYLVAPSGVRMRGWRQRRISSNQKLQREKTKTVLTLTGLLTEGLGPYPNLGRTVPHPPVISDSR
jgi:hypothetical protein